MGGEALLGTIITYHVSSTSSVVTREDGCELDDTIVIRLLNAAKGCAVQVGGVVSVAIAVGLNTGIDAGRVAAPDIGPWNYNHTTSSKSVK